MPATPTSPRASTPGPRRGSTRASLLIGLALALAAPDVHARTTPAERRASKLRARHLADALAAARESRTTVLLRARVQALAGDPDTAAALLADGAVEFDDPALAVAAASAYLALAREDTLERARSLAHAARARLLELPDPDTDRAVDVHTVVLTRSEALALIARCDVLVVDATASLRKFAERHHHDRRARRELAGGAVLTGLGVAGLGLLAGGLALRGEQAREPLPSPHPATHDDRPASMIAAGAITGAIGLAAGALLLGLGARDRQRGSRRHARVRVAPTVTGLLVVGRF